MSSYIAPLGDLEFVLSEVLDLERLSALPAFAGMHSAAVQSVLREGARFSQEILSPLNALGDTVGTQLLDGKVLYPPGFAEAYAQYAADGWLGMDLPEHVGGQGLPRVLQAAFAEMTNGANLAFSMLPVTVRAAARLILEHGDAKLVAEWVPALVDGRCVATIVISEPQAGSDVGRTRTLATPLPDGHYRLKGTKCFISNGDNEFSSQIAHMVLARTPGSAAGTRGLSLFLVPKYLDEGSARRRNAVGVVSVERKMGLNASPTCTLELSDARGVRIGVEGRGLHTMFAMVNTMRLEVALQGVAIAAAATSRAARHAVERLQGGPIDRPAEPIIRHPDVQRMLLTMRARTEALRALTLEAALQLDLGEQGRDATERARALGLAHWLLPICKAYATDTGFEVANMALQVFGGYGYITGTGIEQYVRDIRVGAIYEGTNGIQAIDLISRKLIGNRGEQLQEYLAMMRAQAHAAAGDEKLSVIRAAVLDGADTLERVSRSMLGLAVEHRWADVESGAVAYLRLAGLVGCAWMWLRMSAKAQGPSALHRNKRATAEFFARQLMPEATTYAAQALAGHSAGGALTTEERLAGL